MKQDLIAGWIEISGFPKFTTTILPFILGSVIAWSENYSVDLPVLICSLIAVFLLTEFCFVLNACSVYTDYKRQLKDDKLMFAGEVSSLHSTGASGRFNAFETGRITVKQALTGAYLCLVAAIPFSMVLWLILHTGALTIPLGLLGILVAYSYSTGPRLSYSGWGELDLTIGVGWLTVFSGYYLQAHRISWVPTLVALPWIIDVFKLKLMRELPDFEYDARAGRRHLAIRLGKRTTLALYLPLTLASWASYSALLWLDVPWYGLPLLALPTYYTAKSLMVLFRGRVLEREEELNKLVRNAFMGMILIPVALTGIFGLKILMSTWG